MTDDGTMRTEGGSTVALEQPKYLTSTQAAAEAGISRQRLHQLGEHGNGPPRLRLGSRWLYPLEPFQAWLRTRDQVKAPAVEVRAAVADLAAEWGLLAH